jgi:putative transposase
MQITKTFRFRLEPSQVQRRLFAQFAGSCRYIFNQGLIARQSAYANEGRTLTYFDQSAELTNLKRSAETAWLSLTHSQVLQLALKDLDLAYKAFFRRNKKGLLGGLPKFRRKGINDSFRYPQGVKTRANSVFLPKIGWVKFRKSRNVEGKILQATIKREGEHWFVCLACAVTAVDPEPLSIERIRSVGIDVGLKNFAVLSDGTEIANPRFLKRTLRKLKTANRSLSRKKLKGKNWKKQRTQLGRLCAKIKNQRKDFAHKLSTAIVKNHDVIAVEDINIAGLVRNRSLSRSISDVGWGQFLLMLEYKAMWAGKLFVRVDRFLPSSQLCSTCGNKAQITLSVRTYACQQCGLKMDRDWNASLNIRAAGLAVLGLAPNACGGV